MRKYKFLLLLTFLSMVFLGQAQKIHTKVEDAAVIAKEEQKNIMLVFSGSDWCKPCILLKKEILEMPDFQDWANGKLVWVNLDFPAQRKNRLSKENAKYNDELASKYNSEGQFPRILILNPEQELLKQVDFVPGMSTSAFIELIEK